MSTLDKIAWGLSAIIIIMIIGEALHAYMPQKRGDDK